MKKIIQIISLEGQLVGLGDDGRLYSLNTIERQIGNDPIPYRFENVWVAFSEGEFLQDEVERIKRGEL